MVVFQITHQKGACEGVKTDGDCREMADHNAIAAAL
jgi:hypothetical protein